MVQATSKNGDGPVSPVQPGRPKRSTGRTIGDVTFALIPWVTFGYGTFIAFLVAAILYRSSSRARTALLWLSTALYAMAVVVETATVDAAAGSPQESVFYTCQVITVVIGGLHALVFVLTAKGTWITSVVPRQRTMPGAPARQTEDALLPGARLVEPASQVAPLAVRDEPAVTLIGHDSTVVAVAFSPDGQLLATGDDSAITLLWNLAEPRHPVKMASLVLDRSDRAAGSTRSRLSRRLPARSFWAPSPYLYGHALAFSPDGRLLASSDCDGVAVIWDLFDSNHPTPIATLRRRWPWAGAVKAVAFSPDGRLLATGYDDGAVVIWGMTDPRRPTPIATLRRRFLGRFGWRGETYAIGFSPNGQVLATGGFHRKGHAPVRLWDVTKPARPRRLATLRHAYRGSLVEHPLASAFALTFSPDGRQLVTAGDNRTFGGDRNLQQVGSDSMVILWDVTDPARPGRIAELTQRGGYRTGTTRRLSRLAVTMYTGHSDIVHAVALSPNGRVLATGGEDMTVLLWDLTDPCHPHPTTTLRRRHPIRAMAFSPDGRLLATAGAVASLWTVP